MDDILDAEDEVCQLALAPGAPVLAIMHTLTGVAADFPELAAAAAEGFRPVVLLRRGHLVGRCRFPL